MLIAVGVLAGVARAAPSGSIALPTLTGPFPVDAATQTWIGAWADQNLVAQLPRTWVSPGSTERAQWQRYDLTASGPLEDRGLRISVEATPFRRLEAFLVVDGKVIASDTAGYAVPFASRKFPVNDLALPLTKIRGGTTALYFRVLGPFLPLISPRVVHSHDLIAKQSRVLAMDFTYIGALAVVLLIRLILYAQFRDHASRCYLLTAVGLLVGVIGRAGYWDLHLAPTLGTPLLGDFRFLIRIVNSILICSCIASFFEIAHHAPRFSRTLRVSVWLFAAAGAIAFFVPALIANAISAFVQIAASVLGVTTLGLAVRRRLPGAIPTTVAWSGILIMANVIVLHAFGIVPALDQNLATKLTVLALLWEGLINTATLAFRFRRLGELEHSAKLRQQQAVHRQQLLRLLSHDILNPTAVIRNAVWLLGRGGKSADATEAGEPLGMIDRAAQEILQITGRARDLDLVSSGGLDSKPIAIRPVVEEAIQSLRERAHAKEITVTTAFPTPEAIAWGEARLLCSSVIANALSNAIKFSHRGGTIEIGVTSSRGNVAICIADHGVGIPPEDRKFLNSVDGILTSRPGTLSEAGHGFGLQIMSHVVREMGGKVTITSMTEAESRETCGTRVKIVLRAAGPRELPAITPGPASSAA